jgi:extracellular elastinolytic metalloproteinase
VLGLHEEMFYIREDSYRDTTTGVSHIYLRQIVNGVEVSNADINLNILDGKVISFGDSFYRGQVPDLDDLSLNRNAQDHSYYCDQLRAALTNQLASDAQIPFSASLPPHADVITRLYEHNCASLHALDPELHSQLGFDASQISPPSAAALWFVIAAHPNPKVARSLLENFQSHHSDISSSFEEHHLHAPNGPQFPTELLHNVPHVEGAVKATLVYTQTPVEEGSKETQLSLVWRLEADMLDNWYEAYIDSAQPSRIISVLDWVSDSPLPNPHANVLPVPQYPEPDIETSYKLWPWGVNDPTCGARKVVHNPYDKIASPIGWHSIPKKNNVVREGGNLVSGIPSRGGDDSDGDALLNFTTTWGNNVFAQENWAGRNLFVSNYRPDAGKNMTFVYKWGASDKNHKGEAVEPKSYIDVAVAQLFYTNNLIHDLYYRYGFDEVAGNFQQYNFGKGGKENDGVIANAQDGSGYNNANFATPPDGTNGRMRMYVWNTATPFRDGDLEAGIVIHEFSHGLSTRLTGGPANSGCLGWGESGGMGEGWGDFLATTIRSTANYSDYSMGSWASNQEKGIRNFVYSTNMTVNPSTYKTLDKPGYWGVHAIGEVWAEILWVVSQKLIKKHGYSDTLFPPAQSGDGLVHEGNFYQEAQYTTQGTRKALVPKHGNTLMVQLVINAMKLQPCRPSFFDARDAIIQADAILTNGENACELWQGFSERGLGPDATLRGGTPWGGGVRTDGYSMPKNICKDE